MKPNNETFRHFGSMVFLVVLALEPAATLWANALENATQPSAPAIATLQSGYGKLPLSFEANHGQWDASVQFVTREGGHTLFLTASEAVLTLRTGGTKNQERVNDATPHKMLSSPSPSSYSTVRMRFEGADSQVEMEGVEPLPGVVNYFIGDDPAKWRTNIPTYQKVAYKNLYAGIDLVYYGNQGQLEYDLVVAPGADPTQIMLAFDGAQQVTVDEQGDLVLTLAEPSKQGAEGAASNLRLHKPVVYQEDDLGEKHLLTGSYVLGAQPSVAMHLRKAQQVTFQVAPYDTSKPLIIDPVLSWATYLGGSALEIVRGGAVGATGNAYVTGETESFVFPGTADSPIQNTHAGGGVDAYVTKLNATGTAIVYSTYLGGKGVDIPGGIAVDAGGDAYVTGFTSSADFPGMAGSPIQSTFGGDRDVFVTKLNATGTAILYSTYLGGSGGDGGGGIAVDAAGNAYVVGTTESSAFPGTAVSPVQSRLIGISDVFVAKLNKAGTALVYSTYLGGSGGEGGGGIAVDAAGNAYVAGSTESSDFPGTAGSPIQSTFGGSIDAFVTKLNAAGSALLYSTYLGRGLSDEGRRIAVDAAGNAYVTGITGSVDFPGTGDSRIQSALSGNTDAFVTKINEAGTVLLYSAYLGGSGGDGGSGIAVDAAGNAYVTGDTSSPDFPGTAGSPIQSKFGGGIEDAFVTKLNAPGTAIVYSTYLGGSSNFDIGSEIGLDAAGNAYVIGFTDAPGSGFPGTASSPIQNTYGGGMFDAFVAKISSSIPFAAFDARAKIDVNDRHHGGDASYHRPHRNVGEGRYYQHQDGDEFDLKATFTLGGGGNGIDPLKEAVMIQVGTFSTSIPSGSFKQHKGRYVFEGTINGVHLEAVIRSLILGNDYELKVEGHGADLTGTTNPVTVSVTIGDDSGSKSITAKIK